MSDINANFQWKCEPAAEKIVETAIFKALEENSFIAGLSQDLLKSTSTRLFDWVDHVVLSSSPKLLESIERAGFVGKHATPSYRVFEHPGAKLPQLVVQELGLGEGMALAVESIADFLLVRGLNATIEGSPFSGYRRCLVSSENGSSLWVVERRGAETMEPTYLPSEHVENYLEALEKWQTRPRSLSDDDEAMRQTLSIAGKLVNALGEDMSAWIVLEGERKYWQARNAAGQIQKNRQDRLGMGWANHDHHTFRSSRKHFASLVRLFEMLGFHCRERYYAGEEAGWGAQIMENPRARLVLFLDVDLAHDELEIDFAHHPLPERHVLGTVGLWCALHGDSILKAGMHHSRGSVYV